MVGGWIREKWRRAKRKAVMFFCIAAPVLSVFMALAALLILAAAMAGAVWLIFGGRGQREKSRS